MKNWIKRYRTCRLWKEIEIYVFKLGAKRKNNTGALCFNKFYVQYVGERNGDIVLEAFPNTNGESESMPKMNCGVLHISDRNVQIFFLDFPNFNT